MRVEGADQLEADEDVRLYWPYTLTGKRSDISCFVRKYLYC